MFQYTSYQVPGILLYTAVPSTGGALSQYVWYSSNVLVPGTNVFDVGNRPTATTTTVVTVDDNPAAGAQACLNKKRTHIFNFTFPSHLKRFRSGVWSTTISTNLTSPQMEPVQTASATIKLAKPTRQHQHQHQPHTMGSAETVLVLHCRHHRVQTPFMPLTTPSWHRQLPRRHRTHVKRSISPVSTRWVKGVVPGRQIRLVRIKVEQALQVALAVFPHLPLLYLDMAFG